MNYEIDNLDREILRRLQNDSRTPFLEIARDLNVSGGTVHVRVNRLKEEGVVLGSKIQLDHHRLGYAVTSFIGIRLVKARACAEIMDNLEKIPEIVEIHYTTGSYSLFIKVVVPTMKDLHRLLFDTLQHWEDIQSTETFVVLHTLVERELML